jgi:hypothetical protein
MIKLRKAEMKKVLGGTSVLDGLEGDEAPLGTCCWHTKSWSQHQCGLKKADAVFAANHYHAMWCCASCPQGMW